MRAATIRRLVVKIVCVGRSPCGEEFRGNGTAFLVCGLLDVIASPPANFPKLRVVRVNMSSERREPIRIGPGAVVDEIRQFDRVAFHARRGHVGYREKSAEVIRSDRDTGELCLNSIQGSSRQLARFPLRSIITKR
jgi:hypothetical protein